jgi:hypothetical protein
VQIPAARRNIENISKNKYLYYFRDCAHTRALREAQRKP